MVHSFYISLLTYFVIVIIVRSQVNHLHYRNKHSRVHNNATNTIHPIYNTTIAGIGSGCKHQHIYFVNPNVKFPMCMGQNDQDLKNGMSIINLIYSRGYLPTCRVMQLLLWMSSMVHDREALKRELFVDVGANIGSCSVHMAALGFPVIAVEPVIQHVNTIRGSMDINPSFHIDLQHIGLANDDRTIHANFGHGGRNWGASEFHEVESGANYETTLRLRTLDQVIGSRHVTLMKVDCEGCEWETLKSAKKTLRRIPMIKMELVQPSYTTGNETVSAYDIIQFLNRSHYDLYYDHWNEQDLYFGRHGDKVMEVDKMFGSDKFKLQTNMNFVWNSAKKILKNPIDPITFNQKEFLRSHTDIIAIARWLSDKMKIRILQGNNTSSSSSSIYN